MMLISVFTPTYNRAYILEKLYKSLLKQKYTSFEWILVDDGSTDDTRALVQSWSDSPETFFPIRYIYQENAGKHVAWNTGLASANGEVFFPVDSDDYLTDDALELISLNIASAVEDNQIIAISGVRQFATDGPSGGILQTMKTEYMDYLPIDRCSKGITGDLAEAFLTERLREFPFPVFPHERFVPEGLVFNRFCNSGYRIRGYRFPLIVCEYLEDGYTRNTNRLLTENWQGYSLYIKELLHSKVSVKAKFIPACGYIFRSVMRAVGAFH